MHSLRRTKSAKQTTQLGFKLAKQILKQDPIKQATIIALVGELGSGKTTFLQGFTKGLGIREKILSPTFVVMKRFHVSSFKFKEFYHFDCYRLENTRELYNLGWKEIIANPSNIVVVEWADRVRRAIPKCALWVGFRWCGGTQREIQIHKYMPEN